MRVLRPSSEIATFAVQHFEMKIIASWEGIEVFRTMLKLAREVEAKDGCTAEHCDRVRLLATMLGQELGLSSHQLYQLGLGAFLHDLGKVRIPDRILGKHEPLDEEEWRIMRQHPTLGRQMLEQTGLLVLRSVAPIVEQHHERWDGKGYPRGLRGEEILLSAAIVAVVDAYDAMTTDRPYRKALGKDRALEEIERYRGTQFRPDVVDAFLHLADRL